MIPIPYSMHYGNFFSILCVFPQGGLFRLFWGCAFNCHAFFSVDLESSADNKFLRKETRGSFLNVKSDLVGFG